MGDSPLIQIHLNIFFISAKFSNGNENAMESRVPDLNKLKSIGAYQGGYRIPISCEKFCHSPNFPWKIFDFPGPEFSFSSSRWIFCSQMKALWKTVTIEQLLKKIVPWSNRGLTGGGVWSNFCEKISPEIFIPTSRNHFISFPFTK